MARSTALQKKEETRTDVARPETLSNAYYTPRVDILETEDGLTLYADMPGVKREDVDVRFEGGELSVHGHCHPRQPNARFMNAEYGVGNYYRAFTINQEIDADKKIVSPQGEESFAELKQGVLHVHLPKHEAAKPRKITVKGE